MDTRQRIDVATYLSLFDRTIPGFKRVRSGSGGVNAMLPADAAACVVTVSAPDNPPTPAGDRALLHAFRVDELHNFPIYRTLGQLLGVFLERHGLAAYVVAEDGPLPKSRSRSHKGLFYPDLRPGTADTPQVEVDFGDERTILVGAARVTPRTWRRCFAALCDPFRSFLFTVTPPTCSTDLLRQVATHIDPDRGYHLDRSRIVRSLFNQVGAIHLLTGVRPEQEVALTVITRRSDLADLARQLAASARSIGYTVLEYRHA